MTVSRARAVFGSGFRYGPGAGAEWALFALVPLAMIVCLGLGRIALSPAEVMSALFTASGLTEGAPSLHQTVIMNARLPRMLAAACTGAGLGCAGAVLQGIFRNPLVGPQTIGVLSGAGLGGSLMIFLGAGPLLMLASAFGFGFVAVLLAMLLARMGGTISILMLVLAGIVISAFCAALTTMLQFFADPERQLPHLVFWLMGSFAQVRAFDVWWVFLVILPTIILLIGHAGLIDILASGDDEAEAMGVPVARLRRRLLLLVAAICAAVVSIAGIIGWVGLIVPHLARFIVGTGHRAVLPASAALGAAFLVCIDTFCRTATAAEFPIGAVTALIGAPLFMALLWRSKSREWSHD
ncbi:FecCD family ABC transporter permease [Aureimonas fodinaquatilis]|nr:iron ABC transporter permease [Aureimonas fodinaquatilis]